MRIKRFIKKQWLGYSYTLQNLFYKPNSNPIFVFGNQKSGTSIIAALLAKYSGMSLTLDFTLTNRFENNLVNLVNGQIKFEDFIQRHRIEFSKNIIKEPNLTHFIPEIVNLFPARKHVFIVRDPRDNIRSILNRLDIHGDLSNLNDMSKPSKMWKYILKDYNINENKDLNHIEYLAIRWNRFVDLYFQHKEQLILIKYEDFKRNKIGNINKLANELLLDRYTDIFKDIDTQYQKKGKSDIDFNVFFGDRNLESIITLCERNMKLLDYAIY